MAASAATSTATPPTSKRSPTRPEAVRGAVTAPVTRASRLTECRTVRDPGALADLPWDVLLDPQIHTQGPEDVHQR